MQPNTNNSIFHKTTKLTTNVVQNYRDEWTPSVVLERSPSRGFEEFEFGTVCSNKSWIQGDQFAPWMMTNTNTKTQVEPKCILSAVVGYSDPELVLNVDGIENHGIVAVETLVKLQNKLLKLAYVDSRVQCVHKVGHNTVESYIASANYQVCRSKRHVNGDKLYHSLNMTRSYQTKNGEFNTPNLWKSDLQGGFLVDDNFKYDNQAPRQSYPLNHLPECSIVVPRVSMFFTSNPERYGVSLELGKDIRVIRIGMVETPYANNVYLEDEQQSARKKARYE